MSLSIAIMYGVAAIAAIIGLWLLLALRRPSGPARVYVFRMCGIMALALGVVLTMSATALWRTEQPA